MGVRSLVNWISLPSALSCPRRLGTPFHGIEIVRDLSRQEAEEAAGIGFGDPKNYSGVLPPPLSEAL